MFGIPLNPEPSTLFGLILKKYGTVLSVETSVIIAFTTLLSSFLSF